MRNHTGGGGPGFASFPGYNLTLEGVNACRAKCCENPYCVSITLGPPDDGESHGHTCWLNPARCSKEPEGECVAPFAQQPTLMAFVKRANSSLPVQPDRCQLNYPNPDPQ